MHKRYRLLLFDCVNTLYLPDPSRLPRVELDGTLVPSTAGLLLERLRPRHPHLRAEAIHTAAREAWRWAERQRGPELREVPAPCRFRRLVDELGLAPADEALAHDLLRVHMRAVTGSFRFPQAHGRLLETLRRRYRLALLSNFDHGPSLRALLQETGIAAWFDPLLISDGLGYRKPGAAAFAAALAAIDVPAEEILFVGDSLEDDVQGGRNAGLDVAWVNPGGVTAPPDSPPTYELSALTELPRVLEP